VGQITWGELKRRIPHEDPKYLLGTVIFDSDLTCKFWNMVPGVFVSKKPNKSDLPPSTTRARDRFTPAIFPLSLLPT
jgi:hypothetical protein